MTTQDSKPRIVVTKDRTRVLALLTVQEARLLTRPPVALVMTPAIEHLAEILA